MRALLLAAISAALLAVTGVSRAEDTAPTPAPRVDPVVSGTLDLTATYGIGANSTLGAQAHGVVHLTGWSTGFARGTVDLGQVIGFQDEPQFLQYVQTDGLTNDAQRLNVWWTLGHTFFLGGERRSLLGAHVFAGWTQVFSQAELVRPELAIDRSEADTYGRFNVGAMLKYDYLLTDWLGLDVQAVGPFPVQPSYVTTLFHVGVGLTVAFR